MATIERSFFTDAFKHSMGEEKSAALFAEVVSQLGLPNAETYSDDQIQKIVACLKARGGLVKILALNLAVRLTLKGVVLEE